MSPTRTLLTIPRLSKLLFIKCVGQPQNRFNPKPYIETWPMKSHVSLGISLDNTKVRARLVELKMNDESKQDASLWYLM